jgi:ribonuclease HIII
MKTLADYENILLEWCAEHEMTLEPKKTIPYGVSYGFLGGDLKVNMYFGKKGFSFLVQGKEQNGKSELEQELRLLFMQEKPEQQADGLEQIYPGVFGGSDEAGKGDYFGPLVGAGVILLERQARELLAAGFMDSKKLADSKIRKLAADFRRRFAGRYRVIALKPAKYNELYEKFSAQKKNLNHLLAWLHGTLIKDLFGRDAGLKTFVVDRFARESYLEYYFQDFKDRAELVQKTKGERNIAVAAASILARDAYLSWHDEQEQALGFRLPYGAANIVTEKAGEIVRKKGADILSDYAKLHFRNTAVIL